MVPRRYGVLRFVAGTLQVIGWLVIIFGLIGGLAACGLTVLGAGAAGMVDDPGLQAAIAGTGIFGGIVLGVSIILYALFIGILLVAAGQLYFVLMDMEENTRATRVLLERSAPAPSYQAPVYQQPAYQAPAPPPPPPPPPAPTA